jgi:hypothetical protein
MTYGNPVDLKLRQIAELIDAGQKKEARRLLREILTADSQNLSAWELLWRAVYSVKEELICLDHILAINPNHVAARRRMDDIQLRGEASSHSGELYDTTPLQHLWFTVLQANLWRGASRPQDAERSVSQTWYWFCSFYFSQPCVSAL